MNTFPNTSIILEYLDKKGKLEVYDTIFCDALKLELEKLLKLVPTPKYREYKGVIFDEEYWVFNDWHYDSVAQLISQNEETFSDEDFVQLWELKLIPYAV